MAKAIQPHKSIWNKLQSGSVVAVMLLLPLFYLPGIRNGIDAPKQWGLLFAVMILCWLFAIQSLAQGKIKITKSVMNAPAVYLLAATAIITYTATDTTRALLGIPNGSLLCGVAAASLILWGLCVVQGGTTKRWWHAMIHTLLCSGMLVSLIYLLEVPVGSVHNTNSISVTESVAAVYVAIIALLAGGMSLSKKTPWWWQLEMMVVLTLSMIALTQFDFDLSWAVFCFGLSALLINAYTRKKQIAKGMSLVLLAVLVATAYLALPQTASLSQRGQQAESSLSISASWHVTKQALSQDIKSFLVGSGPGNFTYSFSAHRPVIVGNGALPITRFDVPHSLAFTILIEGGVLGAGMLMLFFIMVGKSGYIAWTQEHRENNRMCPYLMSVIWIAWFTLTITFLFTVGSFALWWLWMTCSGLLIIGNRQIKKQKVTYTQIKVKRKDSVTYVVIGVMMLIGTGVIGKSAMALYQAEKQYTKATLALIPEWILEELEQAVAQRPYYPAYYTALAKAYAQQALIEASTEEPDTLHIADRLARAIDIATKATEQNSANLEAWETLASLYTQVYAIDDNALTFAINATKEITTREPKNAQAQKQLGDLYREAEKVQDAFQAYKRAIAADPLYMQAYLSTSALFEAEGDIERALLIFEPIFDARKDDVDMLNAVARLFFNRNEEGDREKAEAIWKDAEQHAPTDQNVLFGLYTLYAETGKHQEAATYQEKMKQKE